MFGQQQYQQQQQRQQQQLQGYANPVPQDQRTPFQNVNRAYGNRTMQMGAQQLLNRASLPYQPVTPEQRAETQAKLAANAQRQQGFAQQHPDPMQVTLDRYIRSQGGQPDPMVLANFPGQQPAPHYGQTEYGTQSYGNPIPGGWGPGGQPQYNPDGSQVYRNQQGYNDLIARFTAGYR